MNEKYEQLFRAVLNGRMDLSDIPMEDRLQNASYYAYAYRFARGCSSPSECIVSINALLKNDIVHCADRETASVLHTLLTIYND